MSFVSLAGYRPSPRYPPLLTPWTQVRIAYASTLAGPFAPFDTQALSPLDPDPTMPQLRNFSSVLSPAPSGFFLVTFLDADGNEEPTDPVAFPSASALGTTPAAHYAVRHRIRDGMPLTDANPVPYNMVRLENLSDQIPAVPTPVQTVFQCRFEDVPTQRYMNAQAVPGTLVAYLDDSWVPVTPIQDIDQNGNFTLPLAPVRSLLVSYAWQYLSDGEIDQALNEARQWLREFSTIAAVPDGLIPALVSYASSRALMALQRSATLAPTKAGDSDIDWSSLAKTYLVESNQQLALARQERKEWYTQGPEALDPMAADVSAPHIGPYTPLH